MNSGLLVAVEYLVETPRPNEVDNKKGVVNVPAFVRSNELNEEVVIFSLSLDVVV